MSQHTQWILFSTETTGFAKPIFAVELEAHNNGQSFRIGILIDYK
jgi:hypothetical protein